MQRALYDTYFFALHIIGRDDRKLAHGMACTVDQEANNLETMCFVFGCHLLADRTGQHPVGMLVIAKQERHVKQLPFRYPNAQHRRIDRCATDRAQPHAFGHFFFATQL